MIKKGDTLIEVTIAIGIFSLVAIAIASVMSSGTAGSQTALETTLAREEIDAQAEAIRFVHDSYITSKDSADGTNPYIELWKKIIGKANEANGSSSFSPQTCQELYDGNLSSQGAFLLNTNQLNAGKAALVEYSSGVFQPTPTYPRIEYSGTTLSRAYGIYVVAVPDRGATIIGQSSSTAAFYDFYIRTCWYGLDANRPSTISTVIRLYNPPTTKASRSAKP